MSKPQSRNLGENGVKGLCSRDRHNPQRPRRRDTKLSPYSISIKGEIIGLFRIWLVQIPGLRIRFVCHRGGTGSRECLSTLG